jgi:hypothetical protein
MIRVLSSLDRKILHDWNHINKDVENVLEILRKVENIQKEWIGIGMDMTSSQDCFSS